MSIFSLNLIATIGQVVLPLGACIHALYHGHKREALALVGAVSAQQIALTTLKHVIESPRPFPNHLKFDSFPSGHAARSFLGAGFMLVLDYIHTKKTGTPYLTTLQKVGIVTFATLIGASRYLCRFHWPIDVAAGALMGLFFGSIAASGPDLLKKSDQI